MIVGRIIAVFAHAMTAFVLAAVLCRALVPAGFMPGIDATSGKIAVVMCSATPGHELAIMDLPDGAPSDHEGETTDCPFAPAGGSILPDASPSVASSAAVYAFEYRNFGAPLALTASALQPNAPPTGPPALI